MRRFYELKTCVKIDQDAAKSIDMCAMWQSIDENKESYIEEFTEQLHAAQQQLLTLTPIEIWFAEGMINATPPQKYEIQAIALIRLLNLWCTSNGYFQTNSTRVGIFMTKMQVQKIIKKTGNYYAMPFCVDVITGGSIVAPLFAVPVETEAEAGVK